jgi:hypothetical protein
MKKAIIIISILITGCVSFRDTKNTAFDPGIKTSPQVIVINYRLLIETTESVPKHLIAETIKYYEKIFQKNLYAKLVESKLFQENNIYFNNFDIYYKDGSFLKSRGSKADYYVDILATGTTGNTRLSDFSKQVAAGCTMTLFPYWNTVTYTLSADIYDSNGNKINRFTYIETLKFWMEFFLFPLMFNHYSDDVELELLGDLNTRLINELYNKVVAKK